MGISCQGLFLDFHLVRSSLFTASSFFLQCSSDSNLDMLLEEADRIQSSKNGFRKVGQLLLTFCFKEFYKMLVITSGNIDIYGAMSTRQNH